MKSKKIIALLLAVVMCFGMAACNGDSNPTPTPTGSDPAAATPTPDAGKATYTYNTSMSQMPTTWNPHTQQTADDADMLAYMSDSFFVFDYNETKDGYAIVPSTVVGDPVDVTADYIGQFGLEEGAENRAWKYTLKDNLCWDDGTPIKAVDYVESAKRLLDPVAQNYRADGLYASSFVVHNAKAYLNSGKTVLTDNMTSKDPDVYTYQIADLTKGDDGVYTTPEGETVYIPTKMGLTWLDGDPLFDYVETYGDVYFSTTHWEEMKALIPAEGEEGSEDGLVPLTDDTLAWLTDIITGNPAWGETEEQVPGYIGYYHQNPAMDFSEVGIFATSDYDLVIVIDQPLSGFYLKYYIGGDWLVKTDLYDKCANVDASGVYTNTYGTTVETSASYGPYKLTSFQLDKQIAFEKNEKWHGFKDGEYQTTNIVIDYVPETTTKLELFQQGKLDIYGLTADDMETYQLSDYTYYSTGASVFGMVMNPGLEQLKEKQAAAGDNINKTILTVKEFRMAMSFGLDRAAFCLAVSPVNSPALALYSDLIVYNPEEGSTYRSTEQAKKAVASFWGVADDIGEGKMYPTIDDAIDSLTGYNLAQAKELFDKAYDIAIEQGLMDEDDVIEIKIGLPNTNPFYVNGYEFLVNNYTEAVKGTKLEGKLTFSKDDTLGNAFGDALRNNQVDLEFGVGFSGSALDPYNLWAVYVTAQYTYDRNTDYSKVMVDVEFDGHTWTASALDWYYIMAGQAQTITAEDGTTKEFACGMDGDPQIRLTILGASEEVVLNQYDFLPLINNSSAQLKGQQINYGTEEYIFGMGFGGVQYMTYNYTDAEWDAFVAANGGTLDYT